MSVLTARRATRLSYPFSAVVGLDMVKLALLVNVIDPHAGGALIRGQRGCGKTTLVRALGPLLPLQRVVTGCPYRCDPDDPAIMCVDCAQLDPATRPVSTEQMRVVELPANANLDGVVGGIDFAAALKDGVARLRPGILAAANRNVLYIDEVNLIGDDVIDALLDVAASGVNIVERDGIAVTHSARFVLVGTMNPGEGDLRPQLLDRFGSCVDVTGFGDVETRTEVASRDASFRDGDPDFLARFEQQDRELAEAIVRARAGLANVSLSSEQTRGISQTCVDAGVAGHRADVVMCHVTAALAALRLRNRGTSKDVDDAADLALAHRARRPIERQVPVSGDRDRSDEGLPQPRPSPGDVELNQPRQQAPAPDDVPRGPAVDDVEDASAGGGADAPADSPGAGNTSAADDAHVPAPGTGGLDVPLMELPRSRRPRAASGKRMKSEATDQRGRHVSSRSQDPVTDIAINATLHAAAPHQNSRGRKPGQPLVLRREDLRHKVREHKVSSLIVFVVDGSASMAAQKRMTMTKAVIMSLLRDAYVRRDRVAAVVFRGRHASTVLRPTSSVSVAEYHLATMAVGGSTPMSHGMWTAYQLIRREQAIDPTLQPLLVLVSDGYPNVSMGESDAYAECAAIASRIGQEGIAALVVDSVRSVRPAGALPMYEDLRPAACPQLAQLMSAHYISLTQLSAAELGQHVVRMRRTRRPAFATGLESGERL